MKTNAEKLLDLAIQVEIFNQEFKLIADQISIHTDHCWMSKSSVGIAKPCLTDWLEKKYEIHYVYNPGTDDADEVRTPYWEAPTKTEKDCPHCYAALKLIEKRKELKQKRGRLKAQITKIVRREILERGAA